jgi:uncharacterized protein (TIGR01244 family)
MADIHRVTEEFAVAPQLAPADFAELKALGFRQVINNRPDSEAPGQMTSAEAEAAATAAGLAYVHAPFVGRPTEDAIAAAANAAAPTLAFCRSGTRSIGAWALAQAPKGGMSPDEIVLAARNAGYDLSPMKDLLRKLSPA